ncbi:MAG: hypothetical protein J6S00_05045, partial [Clostridia bacterium]|nr:hypothetical protein [Clostridia bacterium]
MKARNLSKVLAFMVAVVMIFAALPIMAIASDETAKVYTVSNESPAIPMTVNTQIAVSDLAVTFSDGTVVAGDALTWVSTSDAVVVADGYLLAKAIGTVKLTVITDGDITRNVYVVVASEEDAANGLYKFYTYDFANGLGDEWKVDTLYSGTTTKNGFTTNEAGQTVALYADETGKVTNKIGDVSVVGNYQYSKTKIDAVTGQFVSSYEGSEAAKKKFAHTQWWDYDYFLAEKKATDMESAYEAGIIPKAVYEKAKELGAYIPFVNTYNAEEVTYYLVDGTTTSLANTTQSGVYFYTKNAIFNDFINYTAGARMSTFEVGTIDGGTLSLLGRVSYGTLHIHEYQGLSFITNVRTTSKGIQYVRAERSHSKTLRATYGYYGQEKINVSGQSFNTFKSSENLLTNSDEFIDVNLKFQDQTLTLSSGDQVATAGTELSYDPVAKAGGIGIYSTTCGNMAVKEMYAKINSEYLETMPNATPIVEEPEKIEPIITITGEGTATVEAAVGAENQYTVTLAPADGYKVKVGSLVINGEIAHGYNETGSVYTFKTEDLNNTKISVEYIEDNGQFNTAMLGAQVNPEKSGIRFGSRTD